MMLCASRSRLPRPNVKLSIREFRVRAPATSTRSCQCRSDQRRPAAVGVTSTLPPVGKPHKHWIPTHVLIVRQFSSERDARNSNIRQTHGSKQQTSEEEGPISAFVVNQIKTGQLQEDREQLDVARHLDALLAAILQTDGAVVAASQLSTDWFSDAPPKGLFDKMQRAVRDAYWRLSQQTTRNTPHGIYIFGSVGVGKSFLMDLFHAECQKAVTARSPRHNVRRAHFHEFMLDIHQRMHSFKQVHPKDDPLPAVALSLAQESRILCLDEFQVTDIADASILKRLFSMLWMDTAARPSSGHPNDISMRGMGMIVVATSNRAPDRLYEGGLNRSLFLPFIDTLKRHMTVIEMGGSKDYRREARPESGELDDHPQRYFTPVDNVHTRQALDDIFESGGGDTEAGAKIPVRMGRHVKVPRSNDSCAWFDFVDLCDQPLGAADYLAICERYPVLIVDHVPQLNASRFNEARRFVTLIDVVYESNTSLVLASEVPLNELLLDFEVTVESHDGDEEIGGEEIQTSTTNKKKGQEQEMFVKGEGGSSSSAATTMIHTKDGEVEWSATGRIGVSLAQLSAVQDVSFSFQRAESRLVEMVHSSGRIRGRGGTRG
jgi:protein AFG1